MDDARKINFNLDQFHMSHYKNFLKNPRYADDNITNWELYNIVNDSTLLNKTTFYGRGGKVLDFNELDL